jgi:hypothetical protein
VRRSEVVVLRIGSDARYERRIVDESSRGDRLLDEPLRSPRWDCLRARRPADHARRLLEERFEQSLLDEAELVLPESVAPLDAIHLVTALRLAGDGLLDAGMTDDARLAAGASHHGLTVLAPT